MNNVQIAGDSTACACLGVAGVHVASTIIGATRPEQVTENAEASGHRLNKELIRRIDATLAPALAA